MNRFFATLLILSIFSNAFADNITFEDILIRVSDRDPQTKAILRVDASEDEKKATDLSIFQNVLIEEVEGKARVTLYTSFKNGRKEAKYLFVIDENIKAEILHLSRYAKLQILKSNLETAERKKRIFELSAFLLEEGVNEDEVVAVLGEKFQKIGWQKKGWYTYSYDELNVVIGGGLLHDITKKNQ